MTKLEKVLKKVELKNWPWPIVICKVIWGGREVLSISNFVKDFKSRRDWHVIRSYNAPNNLDEGELVRWVYEKVLDSVAHELSESFHFGGEMVFDPHKNDADFVGPVSTEANYLANVANMKARALGF